MSITFDNQVHQLNFEVLPDCIGAFNNVSPSLPPTKGAIVQDTSVGAPTGVAYIGTGLQWTVLGGGGSTVIGPSVSNIGDLCSFANLTGNVIQDSSINQANVVQNNATVVSGHLASFNGTGGRAITDSGIPLANVVEYNGGAVVSGNIPVFNGTSGTLIEDSGFQLMNATAGPISFTSGASNPALSCYFNCTRCTNNNLVIFNLEATQGAITVTTPDTWTSASAVAPVGYRPNVANQLFPGCMKTSANAYLDTIVTIETTGFITVQVFSTATSVSTTFTGTGGTYIGL